MAYMEWEVNSDRAADSFYTKFFFHRMDEDFRRTFIRVEGEDQKYQTIPMGDKLPSASLVLNSTQQQLMMDELWKLGWRPVSRRYEVEGQIKDQHIQFLQSILTKLTGSKIDFPLGTGNEQG